MSLSDPFLNPFDLFTFFLQDQTEEALYASAGTASALIGAGVVDGELTKVETLATNRSGDGARCFVLEARVVRHEPGMLAEWAAASAIERAGAVVESRASLRPPARVQQREMEWQQDLGSTIAEIVSRPWASWSATRSNVAKRVRARLAASLGRNGDLERAFIAEIPSAVQDVRLDEPVRAIERVMRERGDEQVAEALETLHLGRPEEALVVAEAMRRFATSRLSEIEPTQREAIEQADAAMGDANAAIGQQENSPEAATSWMVRLVGYVLGPETDQTGEPATGGIADHIESYVAAALRGRFAARLRVPLGELLRRAGEIDALVRRELALIRAVAAAGGDHRRRVEQDVDELQRHVAGLITVADKVLRDVGVRAALPHEEDQLVLSVLMPAIDATRTRTGYADPAEVFAEALVAGRRLTDPLRSVDLDGFIRSLDSDAVARLASTLQPKSAIEFRADEPRPPMTLRFAVPGGPDGALGQWLRTHLRDAQPQITSAPAPLLAFGLLTGTPFVVDQLRSFHTTYRDAREQARREGWEARLVSDRRYLNLDDGVASNDRMDDLFVRGIVCGSVMRSRGGTFYVVPPSERHRPIDVTTAKLDAMFGRSESGGGRLGRSQPEIRSTLRAGARIRQAIETSWTNYCGGTAPCDRIQSMNAVEREGVLPTPELLPVLRRLREQAEEDATRLGRQGASGRPVAVSMLKPAKEEQL